jgi:DNA-binding CsgD family transcriptional regulator
MRYEHPPKFVADPEREWRRFEAIELASSHDAMARCIDELLRPLMRELARDVEAAASMAVWHQGPAPPVTLFMGEDSPPCSDADHALLRSATRMLHGSGSSEAGPHVHLNGNLMAAEIPFPNGILAITCALHRATPDTAFHCREALDRLLPLIRPCLGQWVLAQEMQKQMRGLAAAVNHSDLATFLVAHDAEILFANDTGERLLAQDDGIGRRGNRMGGSVLAETLRLQAAIEHVCTKDAADSNFVPIVTLRRKRRRPLMAALFSTGPEHDRGHCDGAVVYVVDPEQDQTPGIEPACRFYGLSPHETRLTCLLAQGSCLTGAAEKLGVREQTARTYLKQIFLKTETNRQAELVWLMLKSSIRTLPRTRTQVF